MDAIPSLHPTEQILMSFGLGKLDDRSSDSVNSHLERCPDCRKRVAEMSADSFLGRVRDARPEVRESSGLSQPGWTRSFEGGHAGPPLRADTLPPGLDDHPDYEIKRELGRGGMGVVYLAHNRLMGRDEVLKVMSRHLIEKPGVLDRFLREIRAVARLRHPNIVAAYAAIRLGESIVFSMEYVEGLDLSRMVKAKGPLPVAHACLFAHQAALGLQHAHEEGLVHRDIKPGNLMLSRRGSKATVKVLDFGLAKATREQGFDGGLTSEGQAIGTPDYIAPEQILDAPNADIRADIYSLGGTLYHLLTGRPPFRAKTLYDVYQAHISRDADPLNLIRPEVPSELAALVAKMMAKDPARRFQTPDEIVQALAPFFRKEWGPVRPAKRECSQVAPPSDPPRQAAPAPGPCPFPEASAPRREATLSDLIDVRERVPTNKTSRPAKAAGSRRRSLNRALVTMALCLGSTAAWLLGGAFRLRTAEGDLVIEGLPDQSEILVDGRTCTFNWPGVDLPLKLAIPEGPHGIEIKHSGSIIHVQEVEIESGGSRLVKVRPLDTRKSGTRRRGDAGGQVSPPNLVGPPERPKSDTNQDAGNGGPNAPGKGQLKALAPIDLIALLDPKRDSIQRKWIIVKGELISPEYENPRIQIPRDVPDEYRLEIVATRMNNDHELAIGLVVGASRVLVHLDGGSKSASGLGLIDGRTYGDNETSRKGEAIFPEGRTRTIECIVRRLDGRRDYRVAVSCDGKPILEWTGDPGRLSMEPNWDVPGQQGLFLGSWWASFQISKLTLFPLSLGAKKRPNDRLSPGVAERLSAQLTRNTSVAGGDGGGPFAKIPNRRGILVGVNAILGYVPTNSIIVRSVQPIYLTDRGREDSDIFGGGRGTPLRIEAEEGYAVGEIIARGGSRLAGFKLVFVKLTPEGRLDPRDRKESPWYGGIGNNIPVRLGDGKSPIVGLHGRGGADVDALGLIQAGGPVTNDIDDGRAAADEGRFSDAKKLVRRAIETAKDSGHQDLYIDGILKLATVLKQEARYGEAEDQFERYLELGRDAYGPDWGGLVWGHFGIGDVFLCRGKFKEAEARFQRAYSIWNGDTHNPNRDCMAGLASWALGKIALARGNYASAGAKFDEVLTAYGNHPESRWYQYQSAFVLCDSALIDLHLGRLDQAEMKGREALRKYEFGTPPGERTAKAVILMTMADIASRGGKRDEADDLFCRALAIQERSLPPDHPELVETRRLYARHLRATDRAGDAQRHEDFVARCKHPEPKQGTLILAF